MWAPDEWSSAEVVEDRSIDVLVPRDGCHERAVVVVEPDERDSMVSISWGCSFDAAVAEFQRVLQSLRPAQRYAVYAQYRLEPSTTPTTSRIADSTRAVGEWEARDRDGRVVSRFRGVPDPEAGRQNSCGRTTDARPQQRCGLHVTGRSRSVPVSALVVYVAGEWPTGQRPSRGPNAAMTDASSAGSRT